MTPYTKKKNKWIAPLIVCIGFLLIIGACVTVVLLAINDDDNDRIPNGILIESSEATSVEDEESTDGGFTNSVEDNSISDDTDTSFESEDNEEQPLPVTSEEEDGDATSSKIEEVVVESIEIIKLPTKLNYKLGESFDDEGLKIEIIYSDGKATEITRGFTCSPTLLTAVGNQTITVSYEGKTSSFAVKVEEKSDYIYEGDWGQLHWGIDKAGVLYITGDGRMADLSYNGSDAWLEYKDAITSLVIEDGVTSIGNYAFFSVHGMQTVSLPNSLTTIGLNSFRDCQGITELILPDSVTVIKEDAFAFCSSMESIYIPIGVTKIDNWILGYCYRLEEITYAGTVDQWFDLPKGENWDKDTPDYIIKCYDGIID